MLLRRLGVAVQWALDSRVSTNFVWGLIVGGMLCAAAFGLMGFSLGYQTGYFQGLGQGRIAGGHDIRCRRVCTNALEDAARAVERLARGAIVDLELRARSLGSEK